MFENVLPIGSVVLLKDALKKVMIIGYKQIGEKEPDKIYDYVAVVYPVGSFGPSSQFLFDEDKIQDVIFKGYQNIEFETMITALKERAEKDKEFADSIKNKRVNRKTQQ